MQMLLDGEAEALTRKAVEMALEGDMAAIRLCMERLLPPMKDAPLPANAIDLPMLEGKTMAQASAAVIDAVTKGALTPGEGLAVHRLIEGFRTCLEHADLETRIANLEQKLEQQK